MSNFWTGKKVLVTGGAGFIGSYVVDNLVQSRGVPRANIIIPRSSTCDLRNYENCRSVVANCDVVFHLAARTGGISFSKAYPAEQYRDCMLMNLHVMEATRQAGVGKFVGIGNILVYAPQTPSPLEESTLYDGKVAETHLGIGMAKRDLVLMCEMYHRQYGLNAVTVLAANAYGPRDRFDPKVSHVIPATIVKCHQESELVVWGDGKPTRDFLYVEDIAEGLVLAAEKLDAPNYYVNLASGQEVSIGELARMIAYLSDFQGEVRFDLSKGGGDPRRCASGQMARDLFEFVPRVNLEEGLRRTIEWYREQIIVASPELHRGYGR